MTKSVRTAVVFPVPKTRALDIDDGSGSVDIKDVEKDLRLISAGSGADGSSVKGRVERSR